MSESTVAGPEVFALTDEQILGMGAEEAIVPAIPESAKTSHGPSTTAAKTADSVREEMASGAYRSSTGEVGKGLTPEGVSYTEPPKWLAREMNDPWIGDEARELWDSVQQAKRETAAYREVIGSPEDAQALKEIYPGGVAEARNAADRARELAQIDAAVFGTPGRGAEELRAGRTQLVERLYAQDPAALREMVEAGVRLLRRADGGDRRELNAETQRAQSFAEKKTQDPGSQDEPGAPAGVSFNPQANSVPHEVASRYREFERAANGDLERSVGAAVGRALEAALPNLKSSRNGRSGDFVNREGQAPSLQERLQVAVREEVEAGLRSDAGLGEQVARILSGRRFDETARAQVVRMIDARAQQLVPGAVKRVVSGWTAATLGTAKTEAAEGNRKSLVGTSPTSQAAPSNRHERKSAEEMGRKLPRGRVDYRKWSDEQILEM